MKFLHFSIFFICISFFAQNTKFDNFEKNIYLGNVYLAQKDYKNSYNSYTEAFKLLAPQSSNDLLNYAIASYEIGKPEEAKDAITKSITNYKAPKDFVLDYIKSDKLRKESFFNDILNNYDELLANYYRNLKYPQVRLQIEELLTKDRFVRNELQDFDKKNVDQLTAKIDTENINDLIEITKKYGYQEYGWLLLWHQRSGYETGEGSWSFFKPYLQDLIKKGEISKSFFSRFEDEFSILNHNTQRYGTYFMQFDMAPIEDVNNLDKRRAEINLPPLYYHKLVYGAPLPKDYHYDPKNLISDIKKL